MSDGTPLTPKRTRVEQFSCATRRSRLCRPSGIGTRQADQRPNPGGGLAGVAPEASLEEEKADDAEKSASEAVHQLENEKSPEDSSLAYSALARALLAEGKLADAQNAAQHAVEFAAKASNRPPKIEADWVSALVDAGAGKYAKAREELAAVLAGANKFGYVSYRLEVRLALAQMVLRSGQPSARTQLAVLEKDARAKGSLLIARKAAGTK